MLRNSKKLYMVLALAVFSLAGVGVLAMASDGSDADWVRKNGDTFNLEKGVACNFSICDSEGYYIEMVSMNIPGLTSKVDFVAGLFFVDDKRFLRITGTPTTPGTYEVEYKYWRTGATVYHVKITIFVYEVVEYVDVTYSAGIGTVKGQSTWTENIVKGTNASLPAASYSTGAYSFKGWATSSSSTTVVSSYKATSNVTLYAVWTQNKVTISGDTNITVNQGSALNQKYTTSPSGATLTVSSYGGLSGQASLSSKTLGGTITAEPGTYYITLSASSAGYLSGSLSVKVTVPLVINEPIQYSQAVGSVFSYEPVTSPTNATIGIKSVKLNGATVSGHGLTVQGRTITGALTGQGTYAIEFTASASGYTSTTKTVLVYTYTPAPSPPPSIGGISATERFGEPRTYDFIATSIANATLISWYVDGVEFASSHNTAVYEFMAAGIYSVKCVVTGADGSIAQKTIEVVCDQSYNRDMAWSGVDYGFIKAFSGTAPTVQTSGPFTSSVESVGGQNYVLISGVPASGDIGKSYSVSIGSDSWTIKVYAKELVAPVADFEYSISDDYELSVTFTGFNASKVLWDYGDGKLTTSTTKSYIDWGYYSVRCIAINNISERVCTLSIEIAIPDEVTWSWLDLKDYYGIVDRPIVISITGLSETDTLVISGSASQFLTVEGAVITGKITAVGVYGLTLTATHANMSTTSHSIVMYIQEAPIEDDEEEDYVPTYLLWIIIVSIILLIIAYFWGRK